MNVFGWLFPEERWNRSIVAAFLILWAISCIHVPYPEFFALQHVPTVLAVVGLVVADRRLHIDRVSFTLVVLFLLLHGLGARYIYSYVPFDDWSQQLLGFRLNERFGFARNHYDRAVHFCFGLLLVWPIWRLFEKHALLSGVASAAMTIICILAMSVVYEIIEWALANGLSTRLGRSLQWSAGRYLGRAMGHGFGRAWCACWHCLCHRDSNHASNRQKVTNS